MWSKETRKRCDRSRLRYESDLTDAEWGEIAGLIPPVKLGGNKRSYDAGKKVKGKKRHILVDTQGFDPAGHCTCRRYSGSRRRSVVDRVDQQLAPVLRAAASDWRTSWRRSRAAGPGTLTGIAADRVPLRDGKDALLVN